MGENDIIKLCSAITLFVVALFCFSACGPRNREEADRLNSLSYAWHYRNLDSTQVLAQRALQLCDDYSAGYAEACNNMAFVEMARMNYSGAKKWLDKVEENSNNQLELLVADVQNMRICQRESHNKDFYTYREKAEARLRRLEEEAASLPQRERQRAAYARSEFHVVDATYFYYIGLDDPMQKSLTALAADQMEADTTQYLNYLYNFGSGGAITQGTSEQIAQAEFDYLMQCYMLASSGYGNDSNLQKTSSYPYWIANSLQALSEHLQRPAMRDFLIRNNQPAIKYLNIEQMPDSLLAGNLAQRALNIFLEYGDTYQIAGAYRTLAECYFYIKDYNAAGDCLLRALNVSKNVNQAPDLVASIRERLCLVYSALDNKPQSDYNRNIYLDLQEQSRQDRQLEARATQLDQNAQQLNLMIGAVLAAIMLVVLLLYVFDRMRRKKIQSSGADDANNERREELEEELEEARMLLIQNKKVNLEQRAKISLVNSITPFIDRMMHEVDRLFQCQESEDVRQERYEYISELTDKINQYNDVLTRWIQMRQGRLNLRIASFPLQPIFDIVAKGKMSFRMKGVELEVKPTDAVVKADRTLTLFMINTIADNARKFTPEGGKVTVSAAVAEVGGKNCIEITIADTGRGMDEEQLAHVFHRAYTGGHGFGLVNCKGIIEKYKKVSQIFGVCSISAESEVGKGSVFRFRLPQGISRMIVGLAMMMTAFCAYGQDAKTHTRQSTEINNLQRADDFADSAYFSNINGTYERTLQFADSAIHYLNCHYLSLHPGGKDLMVDKPNVADAAELKWFEDSVKTNYNIILDLRNESAVAALALHRWSLYSSNNKVYTQLFRERSADNTLADYVRTMQQTENSKTVAIILLLLLLLQLPVAYYLMYYRQVVAYRYAQDRERETNRRLQEDELRRMKLEAGKLHVANSVLDNCLSTLKHETMYYPSRISQIVTETPCKVEQLREVSSYYQQLYSLLSQQAMEQVEANVKYDPMLLDYLFEMLSGSNPIPGGRTLVDIKPDDAGIYATCSIEYADVEYREAEHRLLFTPLTGNMKYLLCRQIVREIGEVTNLRGCGIQALRGENGKLVVEIVLPYKRLKDGNIERWKY